MIGSGATQRLAKVHQCVLQTVARLRVTAIAPEQASQLVAGVGHAGLRSEDRKQRPILMARQIDVCAPRKPKLESPQQVEFCEQVLSGQPKLPPSRTNAPVRQCSDDFTLNTTLRSRCREGFGTGLTSGSRCDRKKAVRSTGVQ
jgi:hypothetical protein